MSKPTAEEELTREEAKLERTLQGIKAYNRADFLHAWKERIRPSPIAARGFGAKRLSQSSAARSSGPDEDEDLLDTDDEDDVDPFFNERRLDAMEQLREMPSLYATAEWMRAIRRKYGCRLSPLDYDLENGIMALETLYICLPELFNESEVNERLMGFDESSSQLSVERDPASPPPSRPSSTSVEGITHPLDCSSPEQRHGSVEIACGVEKHIGKDLKAAARNTEKVVELMGRFALYDWYGTGKRSPRIDYSAVKKSHLPGYIFALSVNGQRRQQVLEDLQLLSHGIQDQLQSTLGECFAGFRLAQPPEMSADQYEDLRMENGKHVGLPLYRKSRDELTAANEELAEAALIKEPGSAEYVEEVVLDEDDVEVKVDTPKSSPQAASAESFSKRIGSAKRSMTPKKTRTSVSHTSSKILQAKPTGEPFDKQAVIELTQQLRQLRKRADSEQAIREAQEKKIQLLETQKEILEKHSGKLAVLTNKLSEQKEMAGAENRRLKVELANEKSEAMRLHKLLLKTEANERGAKAKLSEAQAVINTMTTQLSDSKRDLKVLREELSMPTRSGRLLSALVSSTTRKETRLSRVSEKSQLISLRQENARLRRQNFDYKEDSERRDEEDRKRALKGMRKAGQFRRRK